MPRGEFIRADGLILPNNVMKAGSFAILTGAFRNVFTEIWVGLCDAVPDPMLQIEDVVEPTLGVNGYARHQIPRGTDGWPALSEVNGEPYIESDWVIFTASGAYDQQIRRLMLVTSDVDVTGNVFALSAPLPALLQINASTLEADRKFKYRIYLR